MYYVSQHFGVVVGAVSGVLAAGGKRIDLFGVIVLGLVTALGGGTLRDVVLGPEPALGTSAVFWIRDANYLVTATMASVERGRRLCRSRDAVENLFTGCLLVSRWCATVEV